MPITDFDETHYSETVALIEKIRGTVRELLSGLVTDKVIDYIVLVKGYDLDDDDYCAMKEIVLNQLTLLEERARKESDIMRIYWDLSIIQISTPEKHEERSVLVDVDESELKLIMEAIREGYRRGVVEDGKLVEKTNRTGCGGEDKQDGVRKKGAPPS